MNLQAIKIYRDTMIEASNGLQKELEPLYKVSPDLFQRPLAEMGASDKLKFANDLLVLQTMMEAAKPK